MDRQIVYIGQIPQDTDILLTNLNAYIGLSKLAAAILGTNTQLNGLTCAPTGPASMAITIAPGEIYQQAVIDTSSYGSLPANTNQILKQGIMLSTYTSPLFTAPSTTGFSQNFLIEFQLNEADGGSIILPYFNSANPAQAWTGPNNNNLPQETIRLDSINIQIKAGTAATTGTQTTPSVDSGWVGGWVVTVAHGQTSIVSGNITLYPFAPFLPAGGEAGPIQFSNYNSALETGTANTYAIALNPAITAYAQGLHVYFKAGNSNTGASTLNVNGLGVKNIKLADGTNPAASQILAGGEYHFFYDGTNFQLMNPTFSTSVFQTNTYTYFTDTGAVNAYVITPSPVLAAYVAGVAFAVKIGASHTNTGASTINISGLGAKNIKLVDGSNPYAGAMLAGGIYDFSYDGTNFQLLNPTASIAIQNNLYTYAIDSGAVNASIATLSPAVTAYTNGLAIYLKIANSSTIASPTVNVNGLGAVTIINNSGSTPAAGDLRAGTIAHLVYDVAAVRFFLLNPANNIRRIVVQTFLTAGSFTYTPSSGMVQAFVKGVGGGGAGGGASISGTATSTGGGGGAGSYSEGLYTAAQIGASQPLVAGAGGVAVNGATGGNGANSTFGTAGALMICNGGGGGGTSTNLPIAFGGASGAAGSGGYWNLIGGAGGVGSTTGSSALVGFYATGGVGANSPLGQGGNAPFITSVNNTNPGNAGLGNGSGGSGACYEGNTGTNIGGNGAPGGMIIIEYIA